jgi:lipid A ethanolaminephosphotransferase
LFLMTNASALYFMNTYNIEIDLALIGNILDTDTREVSELWHWMIWVYIGVFGAIPSLAIWFVRMRMPRVLLRLAAPFAVFGTLLASLFATSFTWHWYDQHATRMGGWILPWSYIVNVGRHYNKAALRDREQVLLPDATFLSEPAQKQIVVLVIGEAARAENFAHYGYPRDTNPYTMDTSIVVLPVGNSCATYTVGGTACITTHEGREAPARTTFEPLASYLTRHDVETIWRTNSSGTPPFTATVKQKRARDCRRLHRRGVPPSTSGRGVDLWLGRYAGGI